MFSYNNKNTIEYPGTFEPDRGLDGWTFVPYTVTFCWPYCWDCECWTSWGRAGLSPIGWLVKNIVESFFGWVLGWSVCWGWCRICCCWFCCWWNCGWCCITWRCCWAWNCCCWIRRCFCCWICCCCCCCFCCCCICCCCCCCCCISCFCCGTICCWPCRCWTCWGWSCLWKIFFVWSVGIVVTCNSCWFEALGLFCWRWSRAGSDENPEI